MRVLSLGAIQRTRTSLPERRPIKGMAQSNLNSALKSARLQRSAHIPERDLIIPAETFDEETVRRLIDECLVPVLVEQFLRNKNLIPEPNEREDNNVQL